MKKLAIFLTLLLLTGCSKSSLEGPGTEPDSPLRFKAEVPSPVISRATVDEITISEIDLLVFENGYYKYHVPALNLTGTAQTGYEFDARLSYSTRPTTVCLVANAAQIIEQAGIAVGLSETEVKARLTATFSGSGLSGTIPFSAEYSFPNGPGATTHSIEVKLLRSIAKAEVHIDAGIPTGKFRLQSIQAYRVNDRIQIIPDAFNSSGKVDAPSLADGTRAQVHTEPLYTIGSNTFIEGLYLPEALSFTEREDLRTQATCLVIGGSYEGGPTTYYRINFDSQYAPGRILRNHSYIVRINKVSGPGWENPGEAANSDATEVLAEIIDWDEDSNDIIFDGGASHLSVSGREMSLHFYQNSTDTIRINTNLSGYTVEFCDEDWNSLGSTQAGWGQTIDDSYFRVRVAQNGTYIAASALQNNEDQVRYGYLLVTTGSIRFKITITQATRQMRSYVHIFNKLQIEGDLGDQVLTLDKRQPTNGAHLRDLLINPANYGYSGVVPFAGYNISGLDYQIELVPHLVSAFDVILIPSSPDIISPAEALTLRTWLNGSSRRVLVAYNNCTPLLETFGVTSNLTGVSAYSISPDIPDEIANGPFGSVDKSFTRSVYTTTVVYTINKNNHPGITPILMGNNNEIAIGIDKSRRIVYCTDYFLYTVFYPAGQGGMTGGGTVTPGNTLDILIANLWAWIAETALGDNHDHDL